MINGNKSIFKIKASIFLIIRVFVNTKYGHSIFIVYTSKKQLHESIGKDLIEAYNRLFKK